MENALSQQLRAKFGSQTPSVLVVDNSAETREQIGTALRAEGFHVTAAAPGQNALKMLSEEGVPNLLILEPGLSNGHMIDAGMEFKRRADVPILFISAVADADAMVAALNHVAEDYMVKPLHMGELVARAKRVLLHTGPKSKGDPEEVVDDYLQVNFAQHYAVVNGRSTPLTPTENRILRTLYQHRGRVLSPGFLLKYVWEDQERGSIESLWVHVRRLRSKIEPDPGQPAYVVTVRGKGYCLPHRNQRGQQANVTGKRTG